MKRYLALVVILAVGTVSIRAQDAVQTQEARRVAVVSKVQPSVVAVFAAGG